VTLEVRRARPDEIAACLALRREVFVEEQGVPPDLELDGLDGVAVLLVARRGDRVVGTARMRTVHGAAKAERVAVPRDLRGTGIGAALMAALESEAAAAGLAEVKLNAQESAIPFYERLGYEGVGPRFHEAGIPHRAMRRTLG
jgi:ElaA protein